MGHDREQLAPPQDPRKPPGSFIFSPRTPRLRVNPTWLTTRGAIDRYRESLNRYCVQALRLPRNKTDKLHALLEQNRQHAGALITSLDPHQGAMSPGIPSWAWR